MRRFGVVFEMFIAGLKLVVMAISALVVAGVAFVVMGIVAFLFLLAIIAWVFGFPITVKNDGKVVAKYRWFKQIK